MSDWELDIPDDFDDFWARAQREADEVPLNFNRSNQDQVSKPGFEIQSIDFAASRGRTLHGWIAYPKGARRLPGFLWVPPYGRESMLPDDYGTREGMASMSFNFHGEMAFHREKYDPGRGYFSDGAESPETWIFRRMFLDAAIAVRVFRHQIEVDEDQICSMGMSQGAGISIWLGAWCKHLNAVCADMPFLGRIQETLSKPVHRYPMKELVDFMEDIPVGRARVLHTVSYFDTSFHATRCRIPTQVSLGEKDPAARPHQVETIYDCLPGEKFLIRYPHGHDWTPDMVENNETWLKNHLG